MRALFIPFLLVASSSAADTVVPVATIRARAIISESDLQLRPVEIAGAISTFEELVGKEARVALYPGRPIRPRDIGPPAIVERNQIISLVYSTNGLVIRTEGRALDRAGVDDRLRVMNLSSKTTVTGRVKPDGSVTVTSAD